MPSYRPNSEVWFTADWQLGNPDLARRPFDSVDQMNDELIDNHNAIVEDSDVVWMLGNMIWPGVDIEDRLKLISRINGRKQLICGHLDGPFNGSGRPLIQQEEWVQRYRDAGFRSVVTGRAIARTRQFRGETVPDGFPIPVGLGAFAPTLVHLSHFAYADDTQGNQGHAAWRPSRPVSTNPPWLICGEGADSWDIRVSERMINVSVEAWNYAPVPADVIIDAIKEASAK